MRAKKSYGQHFLTNEHYARQIAQSLILTDQYDHVLEVGPGQGMLTKHLLDRSDDFELTVSEADKDMIAYLAEHYPQLEQRVEPGDFLKLDVNKIFDGRPFGLIGNYPYNISSQILFKMLDNYELIPEMSGMFQKEVADRVVAGNGSKTYGVVGVLVQARYEGKVILNVGPGNFNPPPRVDSAVIRLVRRDEPLVPDELWGRFKHIVKCAFGTRRKMLRNSLKASFDAETLKEEFFQRRPEQVSLEEFAALALW
ncbi:16S rRNA (adenine(1518)-N(6)/adenine(1519)-N(6))-dimethyltransferase RsmA [Lewinella sp. 4G2]|uniref:16S rRNA (adenine(1518)-N(6)/adenine(1519)-N(6))- dimethyltransferase RsmA n=1 Tax=Lewinella sp. 4G2 TaxID=1803372 RepID=UPI0007B4F5BE|nr:16S rRNA (adenine(1518)-N(6)/adenine(1519)-N(6))-dimethyltransferase RsmA [Lewinella sp. 4G2]OAV44421.1 16S rRNA (adenine(1518)-N(6)/adenine(1519)-N(6))-dimethyltransferase [Lewinella sp. 4G2]